jgi:hypothetical protein
MLEIFGMLLSEGGNRNPAFIETFLNTLIPHKKNAESKIFTTGIGVLVVVSLMLEELDTSSKEVFEATIGPVVTVVELDDAGLEVFGLSEEDSDTDFVDEDVVLLDSIGLSVCVVND